MQAHTRELDLRPNCPFKVGFRCHESTSPANFILKITARSDSVDVAKLPHYVVMDTLQNTLPSVPVSLFSAIRYPYGSEIHPAQRRNSKRMDPDHSSRTCPTGIAK